MDDNNPWVAPALHTIPLSHAPLPPAHTPKPPWPPQPCSFLHICNTCTYTDVLTDFAEQCLCRCSMSAVSHTHTIMLWASAAAYPGLHRRSILKYVFKICLSCITTAVSRLLLQDSETHTVFACPVLYCNNKYIINQAYWAEQCTVLLEDTPQSLTDIKTASQQRITDTPQVKHVVITGSGSGIAAELSEADLAKVVAKTAGYSGSDMRNFVQEACQGPVRNAMTKAAQLSNLMQLSEADLRPVFLKDFQVH